MIEASTNPGNYLIIPDLHVEDPKKLPDTWWAEMKMMLGQVPHLSPDFNLSLNVGKLSGQTVKHLHFWVVPRPDGRASTGKGLAALMAEVDRLSSLHS